jgi:hypothetical protein
MEVPRRQAAGRFCPRDVVAESEEVVEGVFEDEHEEFKKFANEIESADARCSRCVLNRPIFEIDFMAAPKIFSGARYDR